MRMLLRYVLPLIEDELLDGPGVIRCSMASKSLESWNIDWS